MKQRMIKTGILLMSVVGAACTGNYLDINSDPYEVTKDQMQAKGYAVSAAFNAICSTVISTDVNTAQFTDCLLGSPLGGYYATSGGFQNTIENFNATDDWTRVFMASDKVIPVLYSNLVELERLTDDPITQAMAKVVKVCAMNRVTDTYGPIPYSQIGKNGKLQVPYDPQNKVYETMFEELNDAIKVLTENRAGGISALVDPIYRGSAEKWCKFANSIKLRLAMRIVYADRAKAQEMAESAVKNEVGVFTSNDDNAKLPAVAFGDKGNPIYTAVKYNQQAGSVTGGDTHAAADIICYMNGYNDARREKYFIASEWPDIKYVGLRRSIKIPSLATTGRKYSGVNVEPKSDVSWMNAAEVAFLKAEAKAVFGFDMGGEAKDFYNEGIRLSFAQWGAAGADAYLADAVSVPDAYTDPAGLNTYAGKLSTLTIAWNDAATHEEMQERIINQKWIANYHIGNEAWADYRRTGFPKLMPPTNEGNQSNGVVRNELGARRMPYPQGEVTNNPANYQEAVASFLKGTDNMGTRIWWDCNPSIQ